MKRFNGSDTANDFTVFVTSHVGRVRGNNEDNFALNSLSKKLEFDNVNFVKEVSQPFLAAVFDGMGGEAKGEYASEIAASAAKELYTRTCKSGCDDFEQEANRFVTLANNRIRNFLEENRCGTGGSTVAAVIVKNGIAYPFSMGDSRIYLLRSGKLLQISKDHTLAQKKVDANIYTPEEAMRSYDSHKLTKFLGVDCDMEGLEAEYYDSVCIQNDDMLLLCSDGLYDEVSDKEIARTMTDYPENPSLELVRTAIKNGGSDNITCVVINGK